MQPNLYQEGQLTVTEKSLDDMDTLGGWHPDESRRKFPVGSCFENEGRYLYKTVRSLKPRIVVEIGRWFGCSSSHLALGLAHNGFGKLYSLDINAGTGSMIPDNLRSWIEFLNVDVLTYEWPKDLRIDLLLEDGMHSPGFTSNILRRYKARRIIVHDYFHHLTPNVKAECHEVLGHPHSTFFEPPSDCGYAIYDFPEQ